LKLKERRLERKLEQQDLASRVGTNAPMMSNFERYKCLPIPVMLKEICKQLDCSVDDLYERGEIYIDGRAAGKKPFGAEVRQEPSVYKLSVRLPDEARAVLTQANLEKCGYHSLKDFVWHSYKRFEKQLAIVQEKERAAPNGNSETAHESGNTTKTHH
jgi:transcriptional regulator with XRE-family HTH domain